MKNWTKLFPNSLILLLLWPTQLQAIAASGGTYELSKCLVDDSGVNQATSGEYSAAYAIGEEAAGFDIQNTEYDLATGYFSGFASGYVGNFGLLNATIGPTKILQDGYQVGVPLNATIQLDFSSPLDPTTIVGGIQVFAVMDHLGQSEDAIPPFTFTYDVTGSTVVISPQGTWLGNTVYNVVINQSLQSIDGFVMPQDQRTPFVTVLDPHQENIVLHPVPILNVAPAASAISGSALQMDIPSDSLTDYSYILISQDPLDQPLQVDPKILQTATQKAQISGGTYETPLALQEIAAYNAQGQPMTLAKTVSFSISANGGSLITNNGIPIHADTLSLWALDSAHALWVKMPDSRPNGIGVTGGVTQFSVYALMGSASGDTSNVFVFPNPWRPHGPGAGIGSGLTGTDGGGMTFANLPSECDIKIYTLSGQRVRQLHHSDLVGPVGEEKWDGNTSGGEHSASGIYLWRVESASDGKNGKLFIIR